MNRKLNHPSHEVARMTFAVAHTSRRVSAVYARAEPERTMIKCKVPGEVQCKARLWRSAMVVIAAATAGCDQGMGPLHRGGPERRHRGRPSWIAAKAQPRCDLRRAVDNPGRQLLAASGGDCAHARRPVWAVADREAAGRSGANLYASRTGVMDPIHAAPLTMRSKTQSRQGASKWWNTCGRSRTASDRAASPRSAYRRSLRRTCDDKFGATRTATWPCS